MAVPPAHPGIDGITGCAVGIHAKTVVQGHQRQVIGLFDAYEQPGVSIIIVIDEFQFWVQHPGPGQHRNALRVGDRPAEQGGLIRQGAIRIPVDFHRDTGHGLTRREIDHPDQGVVVSGLYMDMKGRYLSKKPAFPWIFLHPGGRVHPALHHTGFTVQHLTNTEGGSERDILRVGEFKSLPLAGGLSLCI